MTRRDFEVLCGYLNKLADWGKLRHINFAGITMAETIRHNGLFAEIIDLSRQISLHLGKDGELDKSEVAFLKLFRGYEKKKPGDMAEADELRNETRKEEVDRLKVIMEAADIVYYYSKLPGKLNSIDHMNRLARSVGLDNAKELINVAVVKYRSRIEASRHGLRRKERKEFEQDRVEDYLLGVNLGEMDPLAVDEVLTSIENDYSFLDQSESGMNE